MADNSQPQPDQKSPPEAQEFSDSEMEQVKRFGQALGGSPTDFDEEVERCLNERLHVKGELPNEEEQ
jgi:hypothetical protein